MSFTLSRAREIVLLRARPVPRMTQVEHHRAKDYQHRWDRHCREVSAATSIVRQYPKVLSHFCQYNLQYVDNPHRPPLGSAPLDMLYITALENALRHRYVPITEQSPVCIDPDWEWVCYEYVYRVFRSGYGQAWVETITDMIGDIFIHVNSPIFPSVMVRAFSELIPSLTSYLDSEFTLYEYPPFIQDFSFLIRALYKSYYAY